MRRLAELGYSEGAGTILEARSADDDEERLPKLAHELIALKCDVIVAMGTDQTARALQNAGSTVPLVLLAIVYDPLDRGIVTSLRKPDRPNTGVYVPQRLLVAKRLEIMREVLPKARRFLAFADVWSRDQIDPLRRAAEAAHLELHVVEFSRSSYDLAAAFEAGRKKRVEAFIGLASPAVIGHEEAISALLLKHRLPGIGSTLHRTEAGYLLGFTTNVTKTSGRVAEIVARILKGAKPEDIPVEQADEFELAINAKTARALNIKIPETVLARATRIV